MAFRGALVNLNTTENVVNATNTIVPFHEAEYQTLVATYKWWLGAQNAFTAEATDDKLTLTSHGMAQGDGPFQVSNSGGALPAGLSVSTNYWVATVDTVNTFQVASSLANALAGTQIDLTTNGTGTQTILRASRLVIPTGITAVELACGFQMSADPDNSRTITIYKNGSASYVGVPNFKQVAPGVGVAMMTLHTPRLVVVAGDEFSVNIFQDGGSTETLAADLTWFAIKEVP